MGFKVYRMSVSWARIFPNGDDEKPNQKGLDFYRDVFNECHKYGIEPLVSIMHHDTPMALAIKQDGWLCKDTCTINITKIVHCHINFIKCNPIMN